MLFKMFLGIFDIEPEKSNYDQTELKKVLRRSVGDLSVPDFLLYKGCIYSTNCREILSVLNFGASKTILKAPKREILINHAFFTEHIA